MNRHTLEDRLAEVIGDMAGYSTLEKEGEGEWLRKRARDIIQNVGMDKAETFVDVYCIIL